MVSKVPEGWSRVTISDIISNQRDSLATKTLSQSRVLYFSIPIFDETGAPEIVDGSEIGSSKYKVPLDCVLLAKLNPRIPRVWRVQHSGERLAACSTEFWPLIPKSNNILLDFLKFTLESEAFLTNPLIAPASSTKSHQRIKRTSFEKYTFPLPPLPEQKKIAAILSSVDEAIEATEAVIEQTRTVKKGLLQELLTRGIGHTEFKKTAIGETPRSWRLSTLGDEFSSSSLKNGIYKPQDLYGSGTQIVRIDNYQNGEHLDSSKLRKVQLDPDEIESYELQHGDILINRVNSLSHLGKTTYISNLTERTVFESNMMRLRLPNNPTLSPEFIFLHLASDHIKSFFQGRAKKAVAQTSISQDDILAIPVTIPPKKEQDEICIIFDSIETILIRNNEQLHYLKTLKRGLLQDLLTGKVRVNTLDLPALLNAEAPAEAQAE
ncbi:hypothetical protein FRC96_19070 [Lujinxingia vulgaris]|uniref:Type I restriction modification DNA specificity domain-containing protein n=1 Tax=Lujinxingia vulgaris TaxID=2600176 RepID=A0A5C6WW87_9DELT|nr:restriction endonuclease subunit S [Lujinxingia vulgaris]TXD32098.1 hypothetical protein FRC96_19070 [Lujinxingia vulgaris]